MDLSRSPGCVPEQRENDGQHSFLYDELFEVDTLRSAGQNFYSIIRLPINRFNDRPLFSTAAETPPTKFLPDAKY
jgi:hypothetical protein